MHTEETEDKGEKAKSTCFGLAPMDRRMFEMMSKCCTGEGEFPDCSVMMKNMMETAHNQSCCAPRTEDNEPGRRKK
jgi:hypothetical protein